MDPTTRTMKRVEIEDALEADRIFTILMGDKVARREFIETHTPSWTCSGHRYLMKVVRRGTVSTTGVLRWSWLLGVALMAPAASGRWADRRHPQPVVVQHRAPARDRSASAAEPLGGGSKASHPQGGLIPAAAEALVHR